MKYEYHIGEASMDERHWSISTTRPLTKEEINKEFSNAYMRDGKKPQTIKLDTGVQVTVVFYGVEFCDDAQVSLYHGDLREEE